MQTYRAEVTEAACQLICDWAQKILKRSFLTVVEVARFLVQEHLVDPRCTQAGLLTAATLTGLPAVCLSVSLSVCLSDFLHCNPKM